MKVVISDIAWRDVFEIALRIRQHSAKQADLFIDQIYDRCHRIGDMPQAFSLVPKHEDQGIRRRVFGNHLIFYRATDQAVEILRVLHGAMKYEDLLFPEDE